MSGKPGDPPPPPPHVLDVDEAEAGQKLLSFLARRLDAPPTVFHRWIRTGQVRVNGGRAGAFDRLTAHDKVRVPPFALSEPGSLPDIPASPPASCSLPPVILENEQILICVKPAGLPVHGGTGHIDSLAARLRVWYSGSAFMPTPAHRLDKATSGLILIAKTYAALRLAQDALAGGGIVKTYLAWARGLCPWRESALLEDALAKTRDVDGRERVHPAEVGGRNARLTVRCLEQRRAASLLLLTPHTGRTHQIRVQLAGRGFPLIGDPKYGGPACDQGLLLHACGLDFTPEAAAGLRVVDRRVACPPPWRGMWGAGLESGRQR